MKPARYLWSNFNGDGRDPIISTNSGPHPNWDVERIYGEDEVREIIAALAALMKRGDQHNRGRAARIIGKYTLSMATAEDRIRYRADPPQELI